MAKSELTKKLLGAVKENTLASVFSESRLAQQKMEYVHTDIPALNVALSGKWDGGLYQGITILAGKSRTGKSLMSLVLVKSFLDKYKEGVCVFLDSEGGTTDAYLDNLNIDKERVIHIPVKNVEDAKFQTVAILEELGEEDHIIILFDSLGNTASNKELEDAKDAKNVADMSRAKAWKSYFRVIGSYINVKNVTFIGINHTYDSIGFIPTTEMGGGSGILYAADTVLFMSKSQDKDGKDLQGFNYSLTVYKSRTIREKSVFHINIGFEDGIDKYSDLFDFALENDYIQSQTKGFYYKNEKYGDTGKYRQSAFERNDAIWADIIADESFRTAYENKYKLGLGPTLSSNVTDDSKKEEND